MSRKKYKKIMKKIWYFIWEDDSILSWIVNIVLAFIIIKFLIYPGLSLVLATSHPIVAVVSGSMEHKTTPVCSEYINEECILYEYKICGIDFENKFKLNTENFWNICGKWYKENTAITLEDFQDFSFKNGFNTGDIIFLYGKKPKDINVGDVIAYRRDLEILIQNNIQNTEPVIHRIIKKTTFESKVYFQTKGDHNEGLNFDERNISEDQIIGKAMFRIPYIGWIKIAANKVFLFGINLVR